jgi:hypothetical protein
MHNRKLIIAGLLVANLGIFILPWYCTLAGGLIAAIHFIKYREWLFSGLLFMTSVISGIMGFLLDAVQINWLAPLNSHYNLDNLQFGSIFVVLPLFINLLFIFSFEEITKRPKA